MVSLTVKTSDHAVTLNLGCTFTAFCLHDHLLYIGARAACCPLLRHNPMDMTAPCPPQCTCDVQGYITRAHTCTRTTMRMSGCTSANTLVSTLVGASTRAFRDLAGYIFGANEAKQKMAMTTPVYSDTSGVMQVWGDISRVQVMQGIRPIGGWQIWSGDGMSVWAGHRKCLVYGRHTWQFEWKQLTLVQRAECMPCISSHAMSKVIPGCRVCGASSH